LARRGYSVVIVGRDPEKGRRAIEEIGVMPGAGEAKLILADLSELTGIRAVAQTFLAAHDQLNLLVNNAGVIYGRPRYTEEGLEATVVVNHLCPFLLTHLLLPALLASTPARVVNVNSDGHRLAQGVYVESWRSAQGKRGFQLYSEAKLANLMFTYELARQLSGSGVTVNAIHPGMVDTPLIDKFLADRFFPNKRFLSKVFVRLARRLALFRWDFCSPETAANRVLYLCCAPELEKVNGKYFDDNCNVVESSAASLDGDAIRRVWEISATITGIDTSLRILS
jgi:NAD(P)-dependent dehydrogenase (short-subunit alcohol dehydrogenase family)